VDIVHLDNRKVFDSVDHVTLIEKLCNNINCKLIKWIAAFLHDRKMQVKVKLDGQQF